LGTGGEVRGHQWKIGDKVWPKVAQYRELGRKNLKIKNGKKKEKNEGEDPEGTPETQRDLSLLVPGGVKNQG